MGKFNSIADYRRTMRARIKALEKSKDKSSLAAAKFQVMQAKSMAPRKSGQLRGNIRKRQLKSGNWIAQSWVPGNFKYNFWVNGNIARVTLPTRAFNIRGKIKWPKAETRTRLGIERKMTYAQTRHTGTPGYWGIATSKTRKQFGKVAKANTRKALRVRV